MERAEVGGLCMPFYFVALADERGAALPGFGAEFRRFFAEGRGGDV